jgi:hypothetical protein
MINFTFIQDNLLAHNEQNLYFLHNCHQVKLVAPESDRVKNYFDDFVSKILNFF